MLGDLKKRLRYKLFGFGKNAAEHKERATEQAEAYVSQGNALLAKEAPLEAANLYRQALELTPDDINTLMCLGYALKEAGDQEGAHAALKRGLELNPSSILAHEFLYLLGGINVTKGDLSNAKVRFQQALRIKPDFVHACKDLCQTLHDSGVGDEVRPLLERKVKACPDILEYRLWLSDIYEGTLDFAGVVQQLTAAHGLGMRDASRLSKLGAAHFYLDDSVSALRVFDIAIELDQSLSFDKHIAYAGFFIRAGENEQAIGELQKAIDIYPASAHANSMLLMLLSYTKPISGISYKEVAERFERFLPYREPRPDQKEKRIGGDGPIRIGFVSADFREHPVSHFLTGILKHIDRNRFEVFAYSNNGQNDEETNRLKGLFDHWQDIRHLADDQAAKRIHTDHIDILVDLSGHTGGNRLGLFVLRPAQTQISWLGYFASTGVRCMDYILADATSVPLDTEEWFSEKVYRLPATRLCMTVPESAAQLPVAASPYRSKGFVTFGSFQQLAKINEDVLNTWAHILDNHSSPRLRLQAPGLEKEKTRQYFTQRLVAAGIDIRRVEILAPCSFPEYLKAHADVDVLLDTFPYTGGTTTALGLWMGVPTLTLYGQTMLTRQGLMMLNCAGLEAFVARDISEYIQIAGNICKAPQHLSQIRERLRADVSASPLFDSRLFTEELQYAFSYMHSL